MKKIILVLVILALLFPLVGCTKANTITIKSAPSGAKIFLDEKYIGKTPLKCKVTLGNHTIVFKKAGYEDTSWKFNIVKGLMTTPTIPLASKKYNIKIDVEKRLEVILDRKDTNKATPVTLENIRSGKHEIQLITSLLTEKKIEPKKYIAFKVLLDGRNSKDINFGKLSLGKTIVTEKYTTYIIWQDISMLKEILILSINSIV